jgi:uncharacterized membrane protein
VRRRIGLAALVVVIAAWNAALFAAPRGTPTALAASTYLIGSLVCHQQPERSFHLGNAQLPVCARCLGLYTGALAGVVGWAAAWGAGLTRMRRGIDVSAHLRWRRALIVAAVPTLASVALGLAGVWDGSNAIRAALAFPLGGTIGAALAAVAAGDLR